MPGLNLSKVTAWIEDTLLLDTVHITKPGTGAPMFNDVTGEMDYPDRVTVYEGPGAVQASGTQEVTVGPTAGEAWVSETTSRYRLLTPLSAPVPEKDHLVQVVAVGDPSGVRPGAEALLGRTWRCQDPGRASTVEAVRVTGLDQVITRTEGV